MNASSAVSLLAPAKLNISLRVFGKRPDGFHHIRSVMVPVSLYDVVTVEEASSGVFVEVDDPSVPRDGRNSCHKAASRFRDWAGTPDGVRIRIRKGIPSEAGLGGGSSDAAAVLKGLIALTGKSPPPETVRSIAVSVGADVPFFTLGRPALAEGFGDILTPIEWRVPFCAVIVKPSFGLPTREGYERLGRTPGVPPARTDPPSFRDWEDLVRAVENDFESAWDVVRPELPAIREELKDAGASAAGLSGSGSAVFGLYRNEEEARQAERVLAARNGRKLFVVRNI